MAPLYDTGLFALSADPITNGHLDLILRGAEQCTELIVLVANNPAKAGKYLFDLSERLTMTKRACEEAGITNVQVIGDDGLTCFSVGFVMAMMRLWKTSKWISMRASALPFVTAWSP